MNSEQLIDDNRRTLEALIPMLDALIRIPPARFRAAMFKGTLLSVEVLKHALQNNTAQARFYDEIGQPDMSQLCRTVVAHCTQLLAIVEGGIH